MKPIQTNYKNNKFRSRLEARYAVFFDEIGLRWIYENEGYILKNGMWYLPDFYLPELDCFAEVKPTDNLSNEEMEKIKSFGEEKAIILLVGVPSSKPIRIFTPEESMDDYYVQFKKDKNSEAWRFWTTYKDSTDTEHFHSKAIRKANRMQFEYQCQL